MTEEADAGLLLAMTEEADAPRDDESSKKHLLSIGCDPVKRWFFSHNSK